MMMLRRFTAKPNPLSRFWLKETKSEDCTAGLKKLAATLLEDRVLSKVTLNPVPVGKYCEYCVL